MVQDTLTAPISPRRAGVALMAALCALWGWIERGSDPGPDGGAPVIRATGVAGLHALSADLEREVGTGVKGQAASLILPPGTGLNPADLPQIYADGLHIIPHADGSIAIGSTSETGFADPQATDDLLDAVIARARAALPVLAQAQFPNAGPGSGQGRRRARRFWGTGRAGRGISSPMAVSRSALAWHQRWRR